MAIIKCKMCGGDLNLVEGASTAECEFCGSIQTIPKVDDEKKLTLFARANRLRAACEFDKAAGIYEAIVADFPEEAEAYWGLVLCKYGIEYVDDPGTAKKIPTCHRSSFESVMEDSDFEQALENADSTARRVYRDEAKQIEDIRKGIIAVSANEEPYDIFICYKETAENGDRTLDSVLAQDVYDALTDKGYRVFFSRITLEDKLGMEYEPYIFAALNSAKIMLAFGTDYEYFNAVWVKNEWSRYLKLMAKDKTKHLIPCFKGIDAYDMPKEFARLQAQDLGKVGATQDLLRGIAKSLAPQVSTVVVAQNPTTNTSAMVMRGQFALDDGDWVKADEYFERALDENPQDAKAYVGKVLVGLRLSAVEQINDHFVKLEGDKNYERAIRFSTGTDRMQLENVKEQADRKWYIKCLTVGLKKLVREKERQAILEDIKKKELAKAQERRANILHLLSSDCEEYTIAQIKDSKYFSGTSIATSLLLEDLNIMITEGSIEQGLTAGTYCLAGSKEKRIQLRNESEYARATSAMSAAGSYSTFLEAADIFAGLGDYLDSEEKAAECREMGQQIKAEMEAQQKEQRRAGIYYEQKSRLEQSNSVQTLLNAAEDLEFLGDYKDAQELARQCREKAARITAEHKERERLNAQRMAQQAQWRNAGLCQHCGGTLKGFFSKKCTNCGKTKDY